MKNYWYTIFLSFVLLNWSVVAQDIRKFDSTNPQKLTPNAYLKTQLNTPQTPLRDDATSNRNVNYRKVLSSGNEISTQQALWDSLITLHNPILEIQFQDDPYNHNEHIASDGNYFYTVNGGWSAVGKINKYTLAGVFVASYPINLDMRSIMYNRADGYFYVNTYERNFYKITDITNGSFQLIFSTLFDYEQASPALSWDGNYIYAFYAGTLKKYSFATGALVQTLTGFQCGSSNIGGDGAVAVDRDYIYTWNATTRTVYVYSLTGILVTTLTLTNGDLGMSLSFVNGYLFVSKDGNYSIGTWYGYNIRRSGMANPSITITPSSFSFSLQQGDSTSQTMTIGNTGNASLNWSIPLGSSKNLTTTFAAGNGLNGNMFDITSINNVTINGFDIHPQGNTNIEIYYKSGTYVGSENNAAVWKLASSFPGIVAQSMGTPTPLPHSLSIIIPAGQTYGFYITSTSSVSLNYTNGTNVGNVYCSDANIQVKEGCGLVYPFSGPPYTPRTWNGIVYYSTGSNTTSYWSVSPSSGSVSAGGTANVLVTIRTKNLATGSYPDTIKITNNDPVNNPKNVPVNLTVSGGSSPSITVSPSSFSLSLRSGDSTSQTMTIGNTGSGVLTYNIGISTALLSSRVESEVLSKDFSKDAMKKENLSSLMNLIDATVKSPLLIQRSQGSNINKLGNILSSFASPSSSPWGIAYDGTNLLIATRGDGRIHKVNPSTGVEISSIPAPNTSVSAITWDGTNLWTTGYDAVIYKLNPSTGSIMSSFSSPVSSTGGLAFVGTYLYVCGFGSSTIFIVNPSTGGTVGTIPAPGHYGRGMTFDGINLWYTNTNVASIDSIYKLDINGTVLGSFYPTGTPTPQFPIGIAWDGINLWMTDLNGNVIYKLDSGGNGSWLSINPTSGSISPGLSQNVTLKVNAKTLTSGSYTNTIQITNNDPVNNPKNVPVNLTVTAGASPTISVSPSSFNVSLQQGDSTFHSLTITNSGGGTLTFNIAYPLSASMTGGTSSSVNVDATSIILNSASGVKEKTNEVIHPQINMATRGSDLLAKREISTTIAPLLRFPGTLQIASGRNILWDKTHGVNLGYEPSGDYSSLCTLLNGIGFTITTTTAGVNNVNLALYNIIVVALGSNWNSVYTNAEISAIYSFVQNGGGLLIMAENAECPNGNIMPLTQRFGVSCGISDLSPDDLYLTNLSIHPIFVGVNTIYFRAAGELTATSPAILIARDAASKGAVAVAQVNSGKVLVFGDSNPWSNGYITNGNNQTFAANVFNWLAGGQSSSSGWLSVNPNTGTITSGSSMTLQVKFNSKGLSTGSYQDTINITNNDVLNNPKKVPVNLTVTGSASPTITVSTTSLPSFGNVAINTNSASKNYTVTGSNLTSDILVTAPSGFQVSKDNTTFSGTVTLTQSGGSVPTTMIYARFIPTAAGLYSGNITHTSTGAITQNVSVSGTCGNLPSISPTSITSTSTPPSYPAGTEFWVEVKVGDPNVVTDLYGISFKLKSDNASCTYVDTSAIAGDFLGTSLVTFFKKDDAQTADITVSKTSGSGASGSGFVAKAKFIGSTSLTVAVLVNFSLIDISATNSAGATINFSAGSLSVNISNGTNVWAGDCNNDGLVSGADLLPIGLYYGQQWQNYPTANNSGMTWQAYARAPWTNDVTPAKKIYADANGSGKIDGGDVLAIGLNYGKTHSLGTSSSLAKASFESGGNVFASIIKNKEFAGDQFMIDVQLHSAKPVYGIAYKIRTSIDGMMIPVNIVSVDNTISILGKDLLEFHKVVAENNSADLALTKTSGEGFVGDGSLCKLTLQEPFSLENASHIEVELFDGAAIDAQGNPVTIDGMKNTTAVSNLIESIPTDYSLGQNYPNPFNPSTVISFSLPVKSFTDLRVFDMLGREIGQLINKEMTAGKHEIVWTGLDKDGKSITSGIYFYQLSAISREGEVLFRDTKRMLYLK